MKKKGFVTDAPEINDENNINLTFLSVFSMTPSLSISHIIITTKTHAETSGWRLDCRTNHQPVFSIKPSGKPTIPAPPASNKITEDAESSR